MRFSLCLTVLMTLLLTGCRTDPSPAATVQPPTPASSPAPLSIPAASPDERLHAVDMAARRRCRLPPQ